MRVTVDFKIVAIVVLSILANRGSLAQAGRKNPVEGRADAIGRGTLLYRARCAGCHGLDGRGVSGPDLTAALAAGLSDDRFYRTVRGGVTGTEMPRFTPEQTTDTQIWEILSHLRMLTTGASSELRGSAENGARIFQANCERCHLVNGKGGRLGPDLSRIGAARSPSAIAGKIRDPHRNIAPGFQPVTVVMADGTRVAALRKNEDAFSIQVMDMSQRIQGYSKSSLREIVVEQRSPMPAFGPDRLNENDLVDLVAYLTKLRGPAVVVQ